jgi:DnaJ family protein C protein 25
MAKAEGLLQSSNAALKKKNRNKSRDQIRREEEQLLRTIIEEKLDVRGSYQKPTYYDVLWVQLAMLPYTLFLWATFYVRWWYKFSYKGEEYGLDEKHYMIRRNLKLSQGQWDQLEPEEQEDYLHFELWIKEKALDYKKQQDEANKAKLAESSSYKRYRRWAKKGGAGSITFMDE